MLGMHSSQEQMVTDTDVETDYGSEQPSSPTSPTSPTSTNTEVHIRLDEEQPKTLTKNQKRQLEEELNELGEQDQAMWSQLQSTPRRGRRSGVCLPRGCKVFLLEIFAGAAMLSSIAANQGLPGSMLEYQLLLRKPHCAQLPAPRSTRNDFWNYVHRGGA